MGAPLFPGHSEAQRGRGRARKLSVAPSSRNLCDLLGKVSRLLRRLRRGGGQGVGATLPFDRSLLIGESHEEVHCYATPLEFHAIFLRELVTVFSPVALFLQIIVIAK